MQEVEERTNLRPQCTNSLRFPPRPVSLVTMPLAFAIALAAMKLNTFLFDARLDTHETISIPT